MIGVTRLDGKKYWINPHQIESMECTPDLTISFISGKKVVLKESPEDFIKKIIEYRKQLGFISQE